MNDLGQEQATILITIDNVDGPFSLKGQSMLYAVLIKLRVQCMFLDYSQFQPVRGP